MKTTLRPLRAASLASTTAMKTAQLLTILTMLLSWHCAHAQPWITADPTDTSVSLNATAQFKVIAQSSGGSLTYLWCLRTPLWTEP